MNKIFCHFLLFFIIINYSLPIHANNIVDIGLSTYELKNGITLFNERKYAAAIQSFELSLSYEPLNHAAKYRLGLAYLYAGYAHNAIRIWEELIRMGVANYEVIEQLNALYFRLSIDKNYEYQEPYIFREYYDGFMQGGHNVSRASFILYDPIKDHKLISSTGKHMVVEMDKANNIIQRYGPRFLWPNYLKMPMGIAIYEGKLFVSDFKKNSIFVFKRGFRQKFLFSFGHKGEKANKLLGPMGLTIARDGYLYVVDNGNNRIQKYLPDGTFVYSFGDKYLYRPTDIVSKNNMLYVSDIDKNKNGRIVQFDQDGDFIQEIGKEFLKEPRGLFLDNNDLYISDITGNIYIYNIENKTSRSFSPSEKRVLAPFSVMKDKDQILWRTDFNSQKIAIYTPLQGVYGNIDLSVQQIITDKYPYIYVLVRACHKDGTPITGISKDEIKVSEFNQPIKKLVTDGLSLYRKNMRTQIIIDASLASQQFKPQLEYYIKTFLDNNTGLDQVEIILLDDKVYKSGKMDASVTKIWEFISKHQSQSSEVLIWDEPIYSSVTDLLNNLRNRSIIIFTSGKGTADAFSTYGADILETYANQNSIPIYVVNFTDQNSLFWQKIAEGSHGKYFLSKNNMKEILDLYHIIKDSSPLEYLIEYNAYNYSHIPGLWVDMSLIFERFGLSGVTKTGYYVPEHLKKTVNLAQKFFQDPQTQNAKQQKKPKKKKS